MYRENSSQADSLNICFLLETFFFLHSNDFTFFFSRNRMLMTEKKDLKTVNHPPVSVAVFLLGWPLTMSQFLLFFMLFPQWIKGSAIPTVQIQWILWRVINYHCQRFIKLQIQNAKCPQSLLVCWYRMTWRQFSQVHVHDSSLYARSSCRMQPSPLKL